MTNLDNHGLHLPTSTIFSKKIDAAIIRFCNRVLGAIEFRKSRIEEIIDEIYRNKSGVVDYEIDKVKSSALYAFNIHSKLHRRKSGKPYISHPIGVLGILIKGGYHHNENMAIAAILHDVIEDTEENKAEVAIEIYKNFGEEVLKLCLQLTKYSKKPTYKDFEGYTDTPTYKFIDENGLFGPENPVQDKKERDKEDISRMKENLRGNQEIAILKCCDRSHNIRTLEFFEEEKLKRYIEETFGYIEIIHKLGLKELTYNLTERIYIFLHDIKQNPKLITDISYVVRELKIPDDLKEIIFGIDKEVQTGTSRSKVVQQRQNTEDTEKNVITYEEQRILNTMRKIAGKISELLLKFGRIL